MGFLHRVICGRICYNFPTVPLRNGFAHLTEEGYSQVAGKAYHKMALEDNGTCKAWQDSAMLWIVIGLVAAALIAGGAIAIILIKKKKQLPPATEE